MQRKKILIERSNFGSENEIIGNYLFTRFSQVFLKGEEKRKKANEMLVRAAAAQSKTAKQGQRSARFWSVLGDFLLLLLL